MSKRHHADRLLSWSGALLLIAGVAAWLVALGAVLIARGDGDPSGPAVESDALAQRPTLAAATAIPWPVPSLTATLSPTALPILTQTQPTLPAPTLVALPTGTTAVPPETSGAGEPTPAPTGCAVPPGWEAYTVQQDDTLFAFVLGAGATITVDDLMAANCLRVRWLQVGQVIYLPPGAAENAPPSAPAVPAAAAPSGPRTPACPCTISVPEGWRIEQIADAINAAPVAFSGAEFLAVTGPGAGAPFDFVMERPAGVSMEGFMFPGTYTLQNDTTAEGFRDMLLAAFGANVSAQMRADAAAQGVTFYQALIIASIVQREVRGPETQKLVASVYYNRYRAGNRLASTIPVQYANGGPGNWWPRINTVDFEIDSPYNTYTRAGLPPTPIDSPGFSAIAAAVYPPQTNYYYHTGGCNGSGELFAETYDQHLANVNLCQ